MMSSVEVYDPAMCCSSGVCGPSVDETLTQFAADVAWLDTAGIEVRRYGLAAEPARFVEHGEVNAVLATQGEQGLPAVIVDGDLKCTGRYPSRGELAAWTGAFGSDGVSARPGGGRQDERPAGEPSELITTTDGGGCCAPGQC